VGHKMHGDLVIMVQTVSDNYWGLVHWSDCCAQILVFNKLLIYVVYRQSKHMVQFVMTGVYQLEFYSLVVWCLSLIGAALTGAESAELQEVLEETNVCMSRCL